jgi:protein SCO1/2
VTVDPARDSVEKLADYVPYFHPDFIGVTGDFLTILSFAGNVNAAFQKIPLEGGNYTMDHSANLFIINDKGDFQGFIKPPLTPEKIAADYEAVRKLYQP